MKNAKWFGRPALLWLTLGAAALMVIGGFGPWATVLGLASVAGTHGDGWFLVLGGLAAGGLVARQVTAGGRWPMVVAVVIGVLGAIVAIADLSDINSVADGSPFGDIVDPGWGLYACLIGSVALAAFAVLTLLWQPYAPAAAPAPVAADTQA
jgi:hypothetical protein